jgi:hypothetical protein
VSYECTPFTCPGSQTVQASLTDLKIVVTGLEIGTLGLLEFGSGATIEGTLQEPLTAGQLKAQALLAFRRLSESRAIPLSDIFVESVEQFRPGQGEGPSAQTTIRFAATALIAIAVAVVIWKVA